MVISVCLDPGLGNFFRHSGGWLLRWLWDHFESYPNVDKATELEIFEMADYQPNPVTGGDAISFCFAC